MNELILKKANELQTEILQTKTDLFQWENATTIEGKRFSVATKSNEWEDRSVPYAKEFFPVIRALHVDFYSRKLKALETEFYNLKTDQL